MTVVDTDLAVAGWNRFVGEDRLSGCVELRWEESDNIAGDSSGAATLLVWMSHDEAHVSVWIDGSPVWNMVHYGDVAYEWCPETGAVEELELTEDGGVLDTPLCPIDACMFGSFTEPWIGPTLDRSYATRRRCMALEERSCRSSGADVECFLERRPAEYGDQGEFVHEIGTFQMDSCMRLRWPSYELVARDDIRMLCDENRRRWRQLFTHSRYAWSR
ncbi:MAG: hypothetical protein SF069_06075 [Phycisphaerae bacterium]|nr:hypothetical protein [Phycisphaerae bacterium]